MGLSNAIADIKRIIKSGGFQVDATLKTPDSVTSVDLKVAASNHHNSYDSDGLPINSLNVHITLVESDLIDASYPYKNANGDISLRNHLVNYPDSNGDIKNYSINETMPDSTLGIVVCILGKYGG